MRADCAHVLLHLAPLRDPWSPQWRQSASLHRRCINPSGLPSPRDYLKPALAPLATALTEELAALLAAALDGRKKKTLGRLSQALSDAVPELLQRAFEHELLANGVVAF
jgi:hypothetical protein